LCTVPFPHSAEPLQRSIALDPDTSRQVRPDMLGKVLCQPELVRQERVAERLCDGLQMTLEHPRVGTEPERRPDLIGVAVRRPFWTIVPDRDYGSDAR
jgi:hypothetical protein